MSDSVQRIVLQNVTRLFGATVALRGVSLELCAGPITFVQGPNGAGKSTLMGILSTTLQPTRGRVVYEPFGRDRRRVREHIGWVGHEPHCYSELSGRENVELAARLYGVDPTEAWKRTCARVQAESFSRQPVGTLSRGQKQRIALARALVHQPSVLLLDEPLSGLDSASVERMEGILREERDRGTIVIVISHMAGLAERMEGRRVFMKRGQVEQIVDPEVIDPASDPRRLKP